MMAHELSGCEGVADHVKIRFASALRAGTANIEVPGSHGRRCSTSGAAW